MITLQFSPHWFHGVDVLFDVMGVIVALLIGMYSYKFYTFSDNYRYKFFGFSFLCFSASFLAKIATNIVIYNHVVVKEALGPVIVTQNLVERSYFFFHAGLDAHRFLMLLGLLGVYWLVSKGKQKEHLWIMAFMAFIISVFSFSAYYIFHLTAAFLLLFILKHYYALCVTKKLRVKQIHGHLNFTAFFLLFVSQIVFIFVWLLQTLYVIAQSIFMMGFLVLLVNFIMLVFVNGKKKNKD